METVTVSSLPGMIIVRKVLKHRLPWVIAAIMTVTIIRSVLCSMVSSKGIQ